MKQLSTALALLLLPLTASAATDVLISSAPQAGQSVTGLHYVIKKDLGRAWIELGMFRTKLFDDDAEEWSETTVVPGLGYDAATRSVVFTPVGASPVVCAKLVRHHVLFIKWTSIHPTGACGITRSETVMKTIDDGTTPYQEPYLETYFGLTATDQTTSD